jgi:hypothetical protein
MKEIDKEIDNLEIIEEDHYKSPNRETKHMFLDGIAIFLTSFLIMITLSITLINVLKTPFGDYFIAIVVSSSLASKCINFLQKKHILPKRTF